MSLQWLKMAREARGEPATPQLSANELKAWRASLGFTQVGFRDSLKALGFQATERGVRRWETEESRVPQWLCVLYRSNPQLRQPVVESD